MSVIKPPDDFSAYSVRLTDGKGVNYVIEVDNLGNLSIAADTDVVGAVTQMLVTPQSANRITITSMGAVITTYTQEVLRPVSQQMLDKRRSRQR